MTSAFAFDPPSPLVELLARAFSEPALGALGSGTAAEIPWDLWDTALHGPLREFLSRPGKEFRGALVTACYRLAGRKDSPPPGLPLAIEALHAGSLIVDDIEDESVERRGGPALHRLCGIPTALNAGNWLYFWSLRLLDEVELPPARRLWAQRTVNQALLSCHYGQALDVSVRLDALSPADVPRVVRTCTELKTGSLVGLAAGLGALAGGASQELVDAATRFGCELGIGLQMLDDLSGLTNERRAAKGHEDLVRGRPTWPWAWAAARVDGPTFDSLLAQGKRVRQGEAPGPLERRLAALVAPHGRREAHTQLERALEGLRAVTGEHAGLAHFARELERLEKSYV